MKRWCQETTRSSTTESNDFSWRTRTVQTEPTSTTRGFSLIRWLDPAYDLLISWFPLSHGLSFSTNLLVPKISWGAMFFWFVGSHNFMGSNVLLMIRSWLKFSVGMCWSLEQRWVEYELENVLIMIEEFKNSKSLIFSRRECSFLSRPLRASSSLYLGADDIQPHPAFEDPSEVDSTRWAASRE